MSSKEPIDLQRALRFLEQLQDKVNLFQNSREKAILTFYLEELKYRFWHHTLPYYCTCTDLDFVEYRWKENQRKIVGLFEIKNKVSQKCVERSQPQTEIQLCIAKSLNVPLWITTFDLTEKYFLLEQLFPLKYLRTMNLTEYSDFLSNL